MRGRVLDALDRTPLGPREHTGVRAFEDGKALRTVQCLADERGAYELVLPEGRNWRVCAWSDGHAPLTSEVEDREELELLLFPGRHLELHLVDQEGELRSYSRSAQARGPEPVNLRATIGQPTDGSLTLTSNVPAKRQSVQNVPDA